MAVISLIGQSYRKISNYWPPPKFGSPVFRVLTETEYQHWPLWKNWKMAAILLISIVQKNVKLLTPPKVWVSGFLSVDGKRISVLAIMKKLKNGCHFVNIDCMEKFQITDPPKVWVSSFPSVYRNRISVLAIMKKLKNGCHFVNIDCMEKFQITDPPKFRSLVFRVSLEMEYQHGPLWKNWKMDAILLILIVWKNFKLPTPQSFGLWFSFLCVDGNGISSENWRCKFSFFWIFPWFIFPHHPS